MLTKDEARELLGMEPCAEGGDIYKVTISDVFVHGDEDPAEVTSALMSGTGDMNFDMGMGEDPDDPRMMKSRLRTGPRAVPAPRSTKSAPPTWPG